MVCPHSEIRCIEVDTKQWNYLQSDNVSNMWWSLRGWPSGQLDAAKQTKQTWTQTWKKSNELCCVHYVWHSIAHAFILSLFEVKEHQGMSRGHVHVLWGGGEHVFHVSIFLIIFVLWKRHRWFLLNNKIFSFHDLFSFTESNDKQQSRFKI